jgi:hypothetical protein
MDKYVTAGGDSGGGWSWNNTAYGVHKGKCSSKSIFSVVTSLPEALGVEVMTTL